MPALRYAMLPWLLSDKRDESAARRSARINATSSHNQTAPGNRANEHEHAAHPQELEAANKAVNDAIATSRLQVEGVTRENARLRSELQVALERLAHSSSAQHAAVTELPTASLTSPSGFGAATATLSGASPTTMHDLQEQHSLLSEECVVLREEVATLTREISDLRAAVEEREAAALAAVAQHRTLAAALAQAQESMRVLEAERSAAESQVHELAAALSAAEQAGSKASDELGTLRSLVSRQNDQIRDYRTAIQELSSQANVRCATFSL